MLRSGLLALLRRRAAISSNSPVTASCELPRLCPKGGVLTVAPWHIFSHHSRSAEGAHGDLLLDAEYSTS
jgi:hypothetical protein